MISRLVAITITLLIAALIIPPTTASANICNPLPQRYTHPLLLNASLAATPRPLEVYIPSPLASLGISIGHDLRPGTSVRGFWSWQDYPYAVPNTKPITVVVAKNVAFGNASVPKTFVVDLRKYLPRGEQFSRILMRVEVVLKSSVPGEPAVQYDRPLWIWIDGAPALVGTTVQRYNYTVIVDVTHFYNMLVGKVARISVLIRNCVLPKYHLTGVFYVTIKLLFYPGLKPPSLPSAIIPLWSNSSATPTPWRGLSVAVLTSRNRVAWQQISVPFGISRAVLILYLEGASYDEFWYYNMPTDRFLYVESDGKIIAIAQPFPYMYTGSLNPLLWRPVASIKTYAFEPLVIDVSGLLPLIVGKHNISVRFFRAMNYWFVFGALAVFDEPKALGYQLISYSVSKPTISTERKAIARVGNVTIYRFSERAFMGLRAASLIFAPMPIEAVTSMQLSLSAVQLYDSAGVWSNLSLSQDWSYVTNMIYARIRLLPGAEDRDVGVLWMDSTQISLPNVFIPVSRTLWHSELYSVYGFIVKPKGNPAKASIKHPVYANFTLITYVRESLEVNESPYVLVGCNRVFEGFVKANSSLSGKLMFVSPTGAIITAIYKRFGLTKKIVKGIETTLAQRLLIKFFRKVKGFNEWPRYGYILNIILMKWEPQNFNHFYPPVFS